MFDHMKPAELAQKFEGIFGARPRIFCAPGRVNLLGEHTDYNDGFVMPCAIGFSTRVAISPRPDRKLVIRSEDFPSSLNSISITCPGKARASGPTMFWDCRHAEGSRASGLGREFAGSR